MLFTFNVSVVAPELNKVMVCAALGLPWRWLANVRLVGDSDTPGTARPVPLKLTECGLPTASLVITRLLRYDIAAVGVNVTLTVQLVPGARLGPQVVVRPKSLLATMLVKLTHVPPTLLSVTACAGLVVPAYRLEKLSDAGLTDKAAPWPVPVKLMLCGLPGALL